MNYYYERRFLFEGEMECRDVVETVGDITCTNTTAPAPIMEAKPPAF